jgi:hypothetical protein
MVNNPWTSIAARAEGIRTPRSILLEVAEMLSNTTERKLWGEVESTPLAEGNVLHELNAIVPTLNRYSVGLLTVRHPAMLYPARIFSEWDQTSVECGSAERFEEALNGYLTGSHIQQVVASLLAQA